MQATSLAGPELHQYLTYLSEQAFVGAAVSEELGECERLLRAIADDRLDSELLQPPGKHEYFRSCWACSTRTSPQACANTREAVVPVKPRRMGALQRFHCRHNLPYPSAKASELHGLQPQARLQHLKERWLRWNTEALAYLLTELTPDTRPAW